MTIRNRLWNLARAEMNGLLDRVGDRLRGARDSFEPEGDDTGENDELDADEQLRQYYANLELAPGASWHEVKSAYRRLMRRYHPDRHHSDPEKAKVANELSQKLRVAYEALRAELKDR